MTGSAGIVTITGRAKIVTICDNRLWDGVMENIHVRQRNDRRNEERRSGSDGAGDPGDPGREIREMLKNHDEPLEEWKD